MNRFSPVDILSLKNERPIVALTSYDYCMTSWFEDLDIDIILVGDSLAMVSLGHQTTLPVTMDQMLSHTQSVFRYKHPAMVIADMPFMSYQSSISVALTNAARFIKESGAGAVKCEGGEELVDTFQAFTHAGIPSIGHIGLKPQHVLINGGYKVTGRDLKDVNELIETAKKLESAGIFAIVLECVPMECAEKITNALSIPTIGIGAGISCDGQILVTQDLLGMTKGKKPRFVKAYEQFHRSAKKAIEQYICDVRDKKFPDSTHSYRTDE